MKHNFYILMVFLFFIGCSEKQQHINLDEKPKNQYVKKVEKKVKPNYKGTLYSRQGTSLFADKKDLQIGDILQVNISESLTNDSSNSRALSKKTATSLGGGVFAPVKGVTNRASTKQLIGRVNNAIGVGFSSESANTFQGSAKSSLDEKFSTIVSVVITQVYQNGNYFIKGSKEMLINNEKQIIAISGVIRPYDISPDNTVLSSQIANLKILYKRAGDEADTLEKPWGTRVLEKIWPF